jgi:hypothetical protein
MSLEQIKKQTEELKTLDVFKLSPEQMEALVENLASLLEKGEKQLSEIKIETNE